jgi:hypothetical protein
MLNRRTFLKGLSVAVVSPIALAAACRKAAARPQYVWSETPRDYDRPAQLRASNSQIRFDLASSIEECESLLGPEESEKYRAILRKWLGEYKDNLSAIGRRL